MECTAVLGCREEPTDGVQDYCCCLREALALEGITLTMLPVRWAEIGWRASRRELRKAIGKKQNTFFLMQYTALAWSRRGFSLHALGIMKLLKQNGARCAIVFHDPDGYEGNRAIDHLRRSVQRHTMRRLLRLSDLAIFTIPREEVPWIPTSATNVAFVPVGANLPAPERAWAQDRNSADGRPVVAVFSLSGNPLRAQEVGSISEAVIHTAKQIGPLRVVVLGRNSEAGGDDLRAKLTGSPVELTVLGLIPADEIVRVLGSSDVLLFVRGPISSRRGSALAGIACGLPVIAQEGSETASPITEAGVVLVPEKATSAFAPALVRVLTDRSYRASLAERSRNAQKLYFSWSVIAAQYAKALRQSGFGSGSPNHTQKPA